MYGECAENISSKCWIYRHNLLMYVRKMRNLPAHVTNTGILQEDFFVSSCTSFRHFSPFFLHILKFIPALLHVKEFFSKSVLSFFSSYPHLQIKLQGH